MQYIFIWFLKSTSGNLNVLSLLSTLSRLQGEGGVSIEAISDLHSDLCILMNLMSIFC